MSDPTGGQVALPVFCAAGILTCMPYGVSTLTLLLGGVCFFAGCAARIAMAMYKKLDSQSDVTLKDFYRSLAMVLLCIPLSAVASCLLNFAAHLCKIEADLAIGGILLVSGLRGMEGFQFLSDSVANLFTKFMPGGKGQGGPP